MANLLRSINDCIFGADNHKASSISDEENATVANILQTLLTAEQGGKHLKKQLDDILGTYSWTENILKKILGRVENAIKQGAPMGKAMKDASARALEEAGGFAHDHPFFCAVLAVGVLAILMPWALEALGFAELGVVEGEIVFILDGFET